ncbi:MAG: Ig-like domain-containing protein, partial [Gemmatimonadaceae bacterium]
MRIGDVAAAGQLRRGLAWLAALAALSCSSPTGVDRGPGGAVATVSVSPSASTVMIGAELPLQVVVRDDIGAPLSNVSIVWSVRDGNIASVSPAGVVTGRALGSTQVAASAGGRSGISTITVQQPAVASVGVQPGAANLVVGDSTTLTVLVTDVGGRTVTNRLLVWTSSDTRVATVSSTGAVTASGVGSAIITASSEGKSGTATVTVVRAPVLSVAVEPGTLSIPSGASRPLTVTVVDANRVNVTDREVRWTSSNELVAVVSQSGAVTAKSPGTATITATS